MLRNTLNHGIRGFFSPQDLLHSLTENLQGYDYSQLDASVSFWNKKDWIPEVSDRRKKPEAIFNIRNYLMHLVSNTDATSKRNANNEMNCKMSLFFSFFKITVFNLPFIL